MMKTWLFPVAAAGLLLLPSVQAEADPACRNVETRFVPGAGEMQIVVWVEDLSGNYIDTAYITRLTGQFGLANRPGTPLLKTNFRWPYGRRDMVLPVWAHRRNHRYPKVVMGGECEGSHANGPGAPCGSGACQGDCEDSTIAYHSRVSSYEPFYCSPSGGSCPGGAQTCAIDAMSCASKGTFSKGAFADGYNAQHPELSTVYSLYPPRADLNMFGGFDAPETKDFAKVDDLVAISQATPQKDMMVQPITWMPSSAVPDGDYVLWIEMSQESDFNKDFRACHTNPGDSPVPPYPGPPCNQADGVGAWDFEGHAFLGQPSVLYRVPFRLDGTAYTASAKDYSGYSTWDGSDGKLHAPDSTITSGQNGSGAGRLVQMNMMGDRVSVAVGGCDRQVGSDGGVPPTTDGGLLPDGATCTSASQCQSGGCSSGRCGAPCVAPLTVENLALKPDANDVQISWKGPAGTPAPARYEVRYHEGGNVITDESFPTELAPTDPPPAPGAPGQPVTTTLRGLQPQTTYTIAVRGVSVCGAPSKVVSASSTTTMPQFAVLHGCFVATAAYGHPEDRSVMVLRRFRDERLLNNAAGRLFTTVYYAFSPSLADTIARSPWLRGKARQVLAPIVALLSR